MKEIRELKSTQVLIFPIDEIGFKSFQRDSAIKKIQEKYKLKYNPPMMFEGIPSELRPISFTNGEFNHKDKSYLIERLNIEERKIIISMVSHSKIVNALFDNLRALLKGLDLRDTKPKYEPLVKADETSCVVKLEFSIRELLENSPLSHFHDYLTDKVQSNGFEIEVIPSVIRFKISYLKQPESFKKHKITLTDKDFVLEVRDRTSYEEQIYYTFSPTDSDTHIDLINKLENVISKK
jgi:hypothetical protein